MRRRRSVNNPYHRVTCGGCIYWECIGAPAVDMQDEGLCRRRSPVAAPGPATRTDADSSRAWPVTYGDDDWCGDGVSAFDSKDMIEGMSKVTANTLQTKPNTE